MTVIEKVKARFLKARNDYDKNRQSLINQKTAYEARRKSAEDKWLDKELDDDRYGEIKIEINKELGIINGRLLELEGERGENVDIAQEILLFTRDIYKAYKKGSYLLKRHYLSFFWEGFEVHDGVIKKCISSPLFQELLALKQVSYKNTESKKPNEDKGNSEVIRNDILGG